MFTLSFFFTIFSGNISLILAKSNMHRSILILTDQLKTFTLTETEGATSSMWKNQLKSEKSKNLYSCQLLQIYILIGSFDSSFIDSKKKTHLTLKVWQLCF